MNLCEAIQCVYRLVVGHGFLGLFFFLVYVRLCGVLLHVCENGVTGIRMVFLTVLRVHGRSLVFLAVV